jgi:sterol desaturase/sphingolipid hydroxylase (fatty acid hydroxylase superfamily)
MMVEVMRWSLSELPLLILTAVCAHLVMSGGQTLFHYGLGHRRLGGAFYRNHIKFHHRYYARGNLVSATSHADDGNNTPYFLIPTILVAGVMFFILPFSFFLVATATSAASFYVHVYLDKEYHAAQPRLARFAWFRRKQQLHFVHHLHADTNFAVIDFFWDRLLGTFQRPDGNAS